MNCVDKASSYNYKRRAFEIRPTLVLFSETKIDFKGHCKTKVVFFDTIVLELF